MKRLRCIIETFTKLRSSPSSAPWESESPEWSPDREEEPQYEPRHVDGVIDTTDIQYYFGVRDDRVAVIFKNGAVVSIVDEFEKFFKKVEA